MESKSNSSEFTDESDSDDDNKTTTSPTPDLNNTSTTESSSSNDILKPALTTGSKSSKPRSRARRRKNLDKRDVTDINNSEEDGAYHESARKVKSTTHELSEDEDSVSDSEATDCDVTIDSTTSTINGSSNATTSNNCSNQEQKDDNNNGKSCTNSILILLILLVAVLVKLMESKPLDKASSEQPQIQFNLEQVNELNTKYPGLISPREMRIIKTRLAVMGREVSILMLLGKSKDSYCQEDLTFCVGQTIANVTQMQFGYIDAADPRTVSNKIQLELNNSLAGDRYTVMVDSLEKLPASEVMSLFQFIDKDQFQTHNRGLLIFVVYAGTDGIHEGRKMREAEIAEMILFDKWSPFIPKDSLTSVISRICSSIIKVY